MIKKKEKVVIEDKFENIDSWQEMISLAFVV